MEGELQQVRHLSSQQAQQILSMSASLSAAQADATSTEDELNAQLERARAESQGAQSREAELLRRINDLQAELASAISHHSASEQTQLQELQEVQGQLLQAEQDRARHAQDLETCQQELQNAKQESEAANSAAKTLQGQLQQAVQSLAEMSTQTLETQQLQAQLAAAEKEILRLKEALHHKQQEAAAPSSVSIAGNKKHLQQQGEELQKEAAVQLDSLRSGSAHSEEDRLRDSNTAEARESRHEAEIAALQSQLRGLHAELDHAAADSQSQEHKASAQLTSQIADLQSRLEQATSASMLVADLQQERDAVHSEAQQLHSELMQSCSSLQATQRALAEQSEAAQAAHNAAQVQPCLSFCESCPVADTWMMTNIVDSSISSYPREEALCRGLLRRLYRLSNVQSSCSKRRSSYKYRRGPSCICCFISLCCPAAVHLTIEMHDDVLQLDILLLLRFRPWMKHGRPNVWA